MAPAIKGKEKSWGKILADPPHENGHIISNPPFTASCVSNVKSPTSVRSWPDNLFISGGNPHLTSRFCGVVLGPTTISNMVSERYGDSDFDPDSDEEDGPDGDEEDLDASASENSCSSASQVSIVFGSFGDSVSTPPSPWIAPAIDGFSFTVGDIPCFLDDSSYSHRTSTFAASDEIQKTQIHDLKFTVSAKSTNSTNRDSEFIFSEAAIKNSKHLIIDTVVSCYGPVYDASVFVGKQDQAVITVKSNFQCFDLHDERIVDFDPGGIFCDSLSSLLSRFLTISFFLRKSFAINRLWWMPWDRGKKLLFHGTRRRVLRQSS